jgi:hypothetical protein
MSNVISVASLIISIIILIVVLVIVIIVCYTNNTNNTNNCTQSINRNKNKFEDCAPHWYSFQDGTAACCGRSDGAACTTSNDNNGKCSDGYCVYK